MHTYYTWHACALAVNATHTSADTQYAMCNAIYLCTIKIKRNYFLFHQSNKIGEWRGHSEICLQMTRDRQFRCSHQTVIGQIWHIYLWVVCNNFGLLILCGSQQLLKMVSCPTVGSVMMANGGSGRACLSAVISSLSLSAIFFRDYMSDEMKRPCMPTPILNSLSLLLSISLYQQQWRYIYIKKNGTMVLLSFSLPPPPSFPSHTQKTQHLKAVTAPHTAADQ